MFWIECCIYGWIYRPILWGLAVGGSEGVQRVLQILREELTLAMALCGCKAISEIDPSILYPPSLPAAVPRARL